ncbi:MAG: nucleotide sugar dehydrogenase, partial [Methanomicrobiales archaeon]|nr:nucleotide sugar dehydrogenase [Methanomicrobiales archaeon]
QMLGRDRLDYPAGEPSLYVLARRINDFMPAHMFRLTKEALERAGLPLKGATIALLGWAFLSNSDDTRNTPSEPFRDLLLQEGAVVSVHDPYVAEYPGVPLVPQMEEVLKGADAIVIFAGHHQYRALQAPVLKELSGKKHPVIVDGRNMVDPDTYIREGFIYKGIGRGDKNWHALQ